MKTIRKGDHGPEVETLQGLLNSHGHELSIDGNFGPVTESAVISFQALPALVADGVVGVNTWTALKDKGDSAPSQNTVNLLIVRDTFTDNSTIGKLFLNGKEFCHTLELGDKDNQRRVSCIPTGIYKVLIRPGTESAKYTYDHLHVQDVPDRDYILFHVANYPKDILGCIGVGSTRAVDFVGNSTKTFDKLMTEVKKYNDINLEIR